MSSICKDTLWLINTLITFRKYLISIYLWRFSAQRYCCGDTFSCLEFLIWILLHLVRISFMDNSPIEPRMSDFRKISISGSNQCASLLFGCFKSYKCKLFYIPCWQFSSFTYIFCISTWKTLVDTNQFGKAYSNS